MFHGGGNHKVTLFGARLADGGLHDMLVAHGAAKVGDIAVSVPVIYEASSFVDRRE